MPERVAWRRSRDLSGVSGRQQTTLIGELRETLDFVEDLSVGRFEVLAPVARDSSVPEGLERASAAEATLEELTKLPTYSMARVASEADVYVRLAPYPVTNLSPKDDPMPEPPDFAANVADPDWRPTALTDVYTAEGIRRIMSWFDDMRRYEESGKARSGSGLRRPDDVILDDSFLQPRARGRPWYLLDHVRSGGVDPIIPLEDATPCPTFS